MKFMGGRETEAAAAFQKAVEVAPRSAEAHLALASYLWAKGNPTQAEATLRHALDLDGGNPAGPSRAGAAVADQATRARGRTALPRPGYQ